MVQETEKEGAGQQGFSIGTCCVSSCVVPLRVVYILIKIVKIKLPVPHLVLIRARRVSHTIGTFFFEVVHNKEWL